MNVLIKRICIRGAALFKFLLICLYACCSLAYAETNSVETITANQQGINVIVKITMKNPVHKSPIGFSISNPARIALDFLETTNGLGKTAIDIGMGDVRNVNLVEAAGRSRLVFNLNKPLNFATTIENNAVIVTIDGSGGVATAVSSIGLPIETAAVPKQKKNIRDIDFRRGVLGEGRIVVDLPGDQVAVDARLQGQKIIVDFIKVGLPDILSRRLDVADFGSPVQTITTTRNGDNVRMTIEPKGLWEHSVYQSDSQLVIEVKPIKEDPNKLTQGTQGYRGERVSFNFQNIEVRAVLQIVAEFSGLNIIASETVTGNITLRLKDVPWDQALDVVMQSKGLDMRKNGTVMWIAPKDELLTKEKLELEQKSQIVELEPMKTESFQLNYHQAEDFKRIFATEGGAGGAGGRILSKRGSITAEPRTNQLFVTDIPSKLEEIRKLILKTDIATKQVLIEARIVEADDGFNRALGAKLGFVDLRNARGGDAGYQLSGNQRGALSGTYQGVAEQTGQIPNSGSGTGNSQFVNLPASPSSGNAASMAFSLFSAAANRFLNLELSALEAEGKGKIISSPRILTADQLPAHIEQGSDIPYQQSTSSGATSTAYKKATLSLDVTPQITPDGNIILKVDVHKDSPGLEIRGGLIINTKQIKTQVLVENGGTVVLGGIYYQEETDGVTQVPLLGDIPVLGNMFKSTSKVNKKTELLVFITPRVLTDRLTGK